MECTLFLTSYFIGHSAHNTVQIPVENTNIFIPSKTLENLFSLCLEREGEKGWMNSKGQMSIYDFLFTIDDLLKFNNYSYV